MTLTAQAFGKRRELTSTARGARNGRAAACRIAGGVAGPSDRGAAGRHGHVSPDGLAAGLSQHSSAFGAQHGQIGGEAMATRPTTHDEPSIAEIKSAEMIHRQQAM